MGSHKKTNLSWATAQPPTSRKSTLSRYWDYDWLSSSSQGPPSKDYLHVAQSSSRKVTTCSLAFEGIWTTLCELVLLETFLNLSTQTLVPFMYRQWREDVTGAWDQRMANSPFYTQLKQSLQSYHLTITIRNTVQVSIFITALYKSIYVAGWW